RKRSSRPFRNEVPWRNRWVRPDLVGEVAYTMWTDEQRPRHPRRPHERRAARSQGDGGQNGGRPGPHTGGSGRVRIRERRTAAGRPHAG
ncbi:hypothetical protein AB0J43_42625, partial [Nonomuraea fuscirosea]